MDDRRSISYDGRFAERIRGEGARRNITVATRFRVVSTAERRGFNWFGSWTRARGHPTSPNRSIWP
jgi:hypothetical protein